MLNFTGFPCLQADEGKYIRRAFYVLEGLGPQDPESRFDHGQDSTTMFDHPYFGQLFLAGVFWIIGYPNSLGINLSHDGYENVLHIVESLWGVPRLLMGLLAVLDTFLIYKITEMRYNRTAGFIASLFFAVMPLTWMARWVVLESVLLPFMLSSILFAVYLISKQHKTVRMGENKWVGRKMTLILLSGAFLGLAIFTKIPAFTVIPLIGSIIFFANGNAAGRGLRRKLFRKDGLKNLGIWFIPVLLIPLIWPIYALYTGDFEEWLEGVLWQGQRPGRGIAYSFESIITMDPVLLIVGILGIIYGALRKDFFSLLWAAPFVIFAAIIGWVTIFHWLFVVPAFCISASFMITDISQSFLKGRKYEKAIPFLIAACVALFGLVSLVLVLPTDLTSWQFAPVTFAIQKLTNSEDFKDNATIIISPNFSWIFKYIFQHENTHQIRDTAPIVTQKIIILDDSEYKYVTSRNPFETENETQIERLNKLFNNLTEPLAVFAPPGELERGESVRLVPNYYPYTIISLECAFGQVTQVNANF